MKNIKIGVIGHFGGDKEFTDGQTVKTKEIYNYLSKKTLYEVNRVDTYKIKLNIIKKIFEIHNLIHKVDAIALIVSSRGYKVLLPIIDFFNKDDKAYLYDFVIGGNRQKIFANNKYLLKIAKKYKKIYVETNEMFLEYRKYGFDNVEVMSNFKDIVSYPPKVYKKGIKELKLCTFSRVCKEKGITDSINVIKKLNELDKKHKYLLDIYGNIEKPYQEEFNKLIIENSATVKYCGIVPFSDSSKIISLYDVLLFLTFWPGEGFPGTLIDSFFASTPVIATDWNYNFDILKNNETGIKVDVNQIDEIVNKILYLANNGEMLERMSLNCYNERLKYMPENIIKPFIDDLEKNNE